VGGLTPISRRNLIRRLKEFGFDGPFSGGKHEFMVRDQLRLTLPNPHHGEIGKDLLSRILRQAHISPKEWTKSK